MGLCEMKKTHSNEQESEPPHMCPQEDIVRLLPPEVSREEVKNINADEPNKPPVVGRLRDIFLEIPCDDPFIDCPNINATPIKRYDSNSL